MNVFLLAVTKQELALLIPILVPLGFFAMIFGIIYLYKREILAMIEKGINPRKLRGPAGPRPFAYLKWGVLLVGAGAGLLLAYVLDLALPDTRDSETLYFALIAVGGGIGLIISHKMEMKAMKEWQPGNGAKDPAGRGHPDRNMDDDYDPAERTGKTDATDLPEQQL